MLLRKFKTQIWHSKSQVLTSNPQLSCYNLQQNILNLIQPVVGHQFRQAIIIINLYPMNKRQIILNMQQSYPFGKAFDPSLTIKVRRLLTFSSPSEHHLLKSKIQTLKTLSHPIKLCTVLQDQSNFHLMYEYVPYKLQKEHQQTIKELLQMVCAELEKKGLKASLDGENLGVTETNQVRYYLDVDRVERWEGGRDILRRVHEKEVDRVVREWWGNTKQSVEKAEEMVYVDEQNPERQLHKQQKPPTHNQPPKSSSSTPLQMLKRIQARITQLRKATKKYTPAMRQTFKSNDQLRSTAKQNWKAEKVANRKMSGHTIYKSLFGKKEKKVIQEGSVVGKGSPKSQVGKRVKGEIEGEGNGGRVQDGRVKEVREPKSKTDFEEMQRKEFQNYFSSNEDYVHEFLGILGHSSAPELPPASPNKHLLRENFTTNTTHYNPINTKPTTTTQTIPQKPNLSNSLRPASAQPTQLRQRVTISIKNSDLAMIRFRKKSFVSARK